MARGWLLVLEANASAWSIPQAAVQALAALIKAAEEILALAKNEASRTPVVTARCKEAFDALLAAMRDMKRRYFLTPPLLDSDYIALGLKPHDVAATPIGDPTAQVKVETYLVGRRELGIRILYVSGTPDDPANKGYRIWYSVAEPGEAPPARPDELRKSYYTMRRKDLVRFDYDDSGKTVYFAVQIESGGGKQGPWGPMVEALIP
jgi:hypothetical protein